jgi:hypothetical protein
MLLYFACAGVFSKSVAAGFRPRSFDADTLWLRWDLGEKLSPPGEAFSLREEKRRKHETTKSQKARNDRRYLDVFFLSSASFRVFVIRIYIPQSNAGRRLEATGLQAGHSRSQLSAGRGRRLQLDCLYKLPGVARGLHRVVAVTTEFDDDRPSVPRLFERVENRRERDVTVAEK